MGRVAVECRLGVVLLVCLLAGIVSTAAHAQTADDLAALNAQVLKFYGQGKYAEATDIAIGSLALAERLHGPDHPAVGTSLNNLAQLYLEQGRYVEAEPLYKRSLAIREKALGPDHPAVGTALNNLASLYQRGECPARC